MTRLAARFLRTPVAMLNLFDEGHSICQSIVDHSGRYREGAVNLTESSICRQMAAAGTPFVITDAREDPRLQHMPQIQAGWMVSYLGVPLLASNGGVLGSLCVMADEVREWTDDDLGVLTDLAGGASAEVELRVDMVMRQAAEEDLASTNKRLRIVLEESAIGIALVDLAGRPVEVNPALERMLGYSAQELSARTFFELTHPDDITLDWRLFAELVRGKRSHYQIEKRYLRKDGEVLWGRLTVSAARDPEGSLLTVLGMIEDRTEHREVDALKERVRVLEGLLPICMFCKGIRNESDQWETMEHFITRRSEATFTHGCCPDCAHQHFGEYAQ